MPTLMTVIGTRPQYVKAAALSRELRRLRQFREILVDTGQHYDHNMSGVFYSELELPRPAHHLGVGSGPHGLQTAVMMQRLEELMERERPDGVLVYGDTNSTLAGVLVAVKRKLPVFHVEAGLRSFDLHMPEEINRRLADHVSTVLYAPTPEAMRNLRRESVPGTAVLTGDVMLDAVLHYWDRSGQAYRPESFGVRPKGYALATIHRAENTDRERRLLAIVEALIRLEKPVLWPMHPRTRGRLREFGLEDVVSRHPLLHIVEPVSYLAMLQLEKHAEIIVTDSGGVQKEAYFAGVPCFTLRPETEWTETVAAGWNTLVNPEAHDLSRAVKEWRPPHERPALYGSGRAARTIAAHLRDFFSGGGGAVSLSEPDERREGPEAC